jgi:endonuclease YncB( thermonuclease family)
MRLKKPNLLLLAAAFCAAMGTPLSPAEAFEVQGHALVQNDGSLLINGRVVRLHGVYLPPTEHRCEARILPIQCAERSVLQLKFKVKGYVYCDPRSVNSDGSLNAVCYAGRTSFDPGEDLGAFLILNGWALATPEAPFEYQALEKIARTREVGVWGWAVDSVRPR